MRERRERDSLRRQLRPREPERQRTDENAIVLWAEVEDMRNESAETAGPTAYDLSCM